MVKVCIQNFLHVSSGVIKVIAFSQIKHVYAYVRLTPHQLESLSVLPLATPVHRPTSDVLLAMTHKSAPRGAEMLPTSHGTDTLPVSPWARTTPRGHVAAALCAPSRGRRSGCDVTWPPLSARRH